MPTHGKTTLTQFLIEGRRRHPTATGALNGLVTDLALACKAIACKVAFGNLGDAADARGVGMALETHCENMFFRSTEWGGHVAGMVSAGKPQPYSISLQHPRGSYLLLFSALDGSPNAEVNGTVGSLFSILRAAQPNSDPAPDDFLQVGAQQVGAGYAIYGPSTMLVLTLGSGTHAFTLEPMLGEWVLSHAQLRLPDHTREIASNASNSRFWGAPVRRYVDECTAGRTGPRDADFSFRWVESLVAEAHRILMRGGVFLAPGGSSEPSATSQLRLLFEANPLSMLVEQAGGAATNGRRRVLDVEPRSLYDTVPLFLGSPAEIERIERYHRDFDSGRDQPYVSPLFSERSLFRPEARV
ncbi:MAG: class 1 fructose-bisphosphatase [Burkholderiaceae bacterium]